ncbi:uncharacterized protein LOC126252953 [Schistocerca nitens]|uniref:uncharacterized protein LOC126252953 n=1 Tax=Schistocerca nitens TaxID=7011 RepID=UPI0021175F07|nr:uncharacterized protein LOC126252953 [Schistocerca nitens]
MLGCACYHVGNGQRGISCGEEQTCWTNCKSYGCSLWSEPCKNLKPPSTAIPGCEHWILRSSYELPLPAAGNPQPQYGEMCGCSLAAIRGLMWPTVREATTDIVCLVAAERG